jgi:hypothetical protein
VVVHKPQATIGSLWTLQAYSCDAVHKVPAEQRCSFIRSSCASGAECKQQQQQQQQQQQH